MDSDECLVCPDGNSNNTKGSYNPKLKENDKKSKSMFICSDCGKQLKSKSELKQHMNSKCSTIRLFKCKVCGQELMTAGSLHNHMLRHNGERTFMCRFCAKMFLTGGQLNVHERIHTQEKVYICQICGKGFCHRQSLCTHTTIHTGIKPYQCENCGASFSCVGNLIKHRRTHADTCGLTPLVTHRVKHPSTKQKVKINTPTNTKLKSNQSHKCHDTSGTEPRPSVNAQNKMSCDIADQEQMTGQMVKKELLCSDAHDLKEKEEVDADYEDAKHKVVQDDWAVDNDEKNYLLTECTDLSATSVCEKDCYENFSSENKNDLNTNIKQYVKNHCFQDNEPDLATEENDSKSEISEKKNNCTFLEQSYSDHDGVECSDEESSKELHPVEHTRNFRKRKKVNKHEYMQFIEDRNLENKKNRQCVYCNKKYINFKWLLKHEQEHKKMMEQESAPEIGQDGSHKLYKCSCCKIRFSSKTDCRNHQMSAHADILTCMECDGIFANIDSLRSHHNICHKGVPRKVYLYICKTCGYQFKQKAQLLLHEKHNCEEGPHIVCEICKKQFTSLHTRQAHMKLHNPEKKLLCKYCGKSFHWKGQLKIHERSHTGEKPFTCLYCPRAFAYRESLITHSSLHTGIKPYLCEACGWKFSCIGNLIKHRNTHASTCGVWYTKNKLGNS